MSVLSENTISELKNIYRQFALAPNADYLHRTLPKEVIDNLDWFCRLAIKRVREPSDFSVEDQLGLRNLVEAYKKLPERDRAVVGEVISMYMVSPWRDAIGRVCDPELAKAVNASVGVSVPWKFRDDADPAPADLILMCLECLAEYASETSRPPENKSIARRELFLSVYALFVQSLGITPTDATKGLFCSFMSKLLSDPALIEADLFASDIRAQMRIARDRYINPLDID
jgi:hypothetical protein